MSQQTIKCMKSNCSCECFAPGKGAQLRICITCNHGWIHHALDKFGMSHVYNSHSSDDIQANNAFDVASLVLYGTNALPVRLKILLDRIFCTLSYEELLHLLNEFGWTHEDYARGYIHEESNGKALTRWTMVNREEELLVLQQFLRFNRTKNIAQHFLLNDSFSWNDSSLLSTDIGMANKSLDSDIRKFIERANRAANSNYPKQASSHALLRQSSKTANSNNNVSDIPRILDEGNKMVTTSPATSPTSLFHSAPSPLNRLTNMQPFDFRCNSANHSSKSSISSALSCKTSVSSDEIAKSLHNTLLLISPKAGVITSNSGSSSVKNSSFNTGLNNDSHFASLTAPNSADSSTTDDNSEDETNMSESAINLSQSSGSFDIGKARHLRKSSNPMKRRWNPGMLSTLITNPSTGKKRVQCQACYKTFCDKGALKIHFSAVHLKEMHRCTVAGCNMMFSSRRSRNRHSANPNPKLHTPNLKRKINPHDGRSANPYPLLSALPSDTSLLSSSFSNSQLTGHDRGLSNSHLFDPDRNNQESSQMTSSSSLFGDNKDHFRDVSSVSPRSACLTPDTSEAGSALSLTNKKKKLEVHSCDENSSNNKIEEGVNLSIKINDNSTNKRKRKSTKPIKCAPVSLNVSDDELQDSGDESSSGTYIGRADEMLDDSKSEGDEEDEEEEEEEEDDSLDGYGSHLSSKEFNKDIEMDDKGNHESIKNERRSQSGFNQSEGSMDLSKKSSPSLSRRSSEDRKSKVNQAFLSNNHHQNNHSDKTNSSFKLLSSPDNVTENALRHLESLSMSTFDNLATSGQLRNSLFGNSSSLSFHAPGLGLGLPPTPLQLSQHQKESKDILSDRKLDRGNDPDGKISKHLTSSLSASMNSEDAESESGNNFVPTIDHSLPLNPMFRDASSVGPIEIPVDKENPRKCTACGKIFQNHFGVKTHYQNVHLKLMHKCTVEGCNAAFPSKRSRDRHSSNMNLHRKLLSTHSDKAGQFGLDKAAASALFPYHPGANLRDDIFSRIYETQGLPYSLSELYQGRLPSIGPDGLLAAAAAAAAAASAFPVVPNFSHPAFSLQRHPSQGELHPTEINRNEMVGRTTPTGSIVNTPSPREAQASPNSDINETKKMTQSSPTSVNSSSSSSLELFKPSANENGDFACVFCSKSAFGDMNSLREHYRQSHFDELLKCSKDSCNKTFTSKQDRKRHERAHSVDGLQNQSPNEISEAMT